MKPSIRIMLCLFTELGPAGRRLERGGTFPISEFNFPDTQEGREKAEEGKEKLQAYCDKFHGQAVKHSLKSKGPVE